MNINGINNMAFGANLPIRTKVLKTVDKNGAAVNTDYLKQMLEDNRDELNNLIRFVNKDLVLAQRGNTVLINSGAKTDAIELNKMKNGRELIDGIRNNLGKNDAISRGCGYIA